MMCTPLLELFVKIYQFQFYNRQKKNYSQQLLQGVSTSASVFFFTWVNLMLLYFCQTSDPYVHIYKSKILLLKNAAFT